MTPEEIVDHCAETRHILIVARNEAPDAHIRTLESTIIRLLESIETLAAYVEALAQREISDGK